MDGFTLAEEIKRRPLLACAVLIMLTSAGQNSDCERRRSIGLAACLTKPVKQAELLNTIMTVLGHAAPASAPPPRVTQPSTNKNGRGLYILLTEDNVVNQRLVTRLLEKHGHTVRVVQHGREALAALEQEHFDLVLMDVQMPEIDGFEATALIRERERATGAHLPIIALTAHAMEGDRERCLAAGMDGYLAKPIQTSELFALLAKRQAPKELSRQPEAVEVSAV